jgi:hypothetical protein
VHIWGLWAPTCLLLFRFIVEIAITINLPRLLLEWIWGWMLQI